MTTTPATPHTVETPFVPSFDDVDTSRKLAIICSKGNLDMAYPGLILANAALGEGIETHLFFTFWGFDMINKKTMGDLKFTMLGNTATHMPQGLGGLPGMTAMATHQMRKTIADLGIPDVPEFLQQIVDSGGHLWACRMSADMQHLEMETSTTRSRPSSAPPTSSRRPPAPSCCSSERSVSSARVSQPSSPVRGSSSWPSHRASFGYAASTWSTWRPQPRQVTRPHVRQRTAWHISVSFLSSLDFGSYPPGGIRSITYRPSRRSTSMATIALHAADFASHGRRERDGARRLLGLLVRAVPDVRPDLRGRPPRPTPDIVFAKVDTEAERELAAAARISSIPTLMAFKNGQLVFSQPGALPAPALEQLIAGWSRLELDVSAGRAS